MEHSIAPTKSTSLDGKVILISGSTSGIGLAAALELAKLGAFIVVVGRSEKRCLAALRKIEGEIGGTADYLLADLSHLDQVNRLAGEFMRKFDRLDVLVNNAGAIFMRRHTTKDGYEMTFALNHLSPFLLTQSLLGLLVATANNHQEARVVTVSSGAHWSGEIPFDDLNLKKGFSPWRAYAQSKLANVLFTKELARRLDGTGVTANALNPKFVATGFGVNLQPFKRISAPFFRFFGLSPTQGATTTVYLASSPEVEGVSGGYYVDCNPASVSSLADDRTTAERLWQVSEQMVNIDH